MCIYIGTKRTWGRSSIEAKEEKKEKPGGNEERMQGDCKLRKWKKVRCTASRMKKKEKRKK